MKRHGHPVPIANFAPEVTSSVDLESSGGKPFGFSGKTVQLGGGPVPAIPAYEPPKGKVQSFNTYGNRNSRGGASSNPDEGLQKAALVFGGIWLLGMFAGYSWWWPLSLVFEIIYAVLSTPPFSWVFGWILTPLSWIFGWAYRGVPLVEQMGALQELRLPADQVPTYADTYVHQYGDAALIFACHDGYPQLVQSLLSARELGYKDLLDAADENGNTALIYASAKGYRTVVSTLLRHGADPDIANQGSGGRSPLMESAGAGHKDVVASLRQANASLDLTDHFSNTALHYAAYHGHLPVVRELLLGSPRRDIQNSYGHTAASYAASNGHKAIVDLLNRAPTKMEQERADKLKTVTKAAEEKDDPYGIASLFGSGSKKAKEAKQVHGHAEDLHQRDLDFAPKAENVGGGLTGGGGAASMSDAERKALDDEIARLKHQQDEAELRAQRRIVELLEQNSANQKALDEKDREKRAMELNVTEMTLRLQDFDSRQKSAELRFQEEKQRADRMAEEKVQMQLEVDRHRTRAESAERERDAHMEASRRHEDALRRKQDEVAEYLATIERKNNEMTELRLRIQQFGGGGSSSASAEPSPPPVEAAPPPAAAEAQAPTEVEAPTAQDTQEAPIVAELEGKTET